jgi:16S rRNA processing protein RimM
VGKVIRPHGLKGLLRVHSDAQSQQSFEVAERIYLRKENGETRSFKLVSMIRHRSVWLMALSGLTSFDEAESFRAADILVDKEALGAKEEDEYFWHELLGLCVYLDSGETLGVISEIIPTGANDIYVVETADGEILVPAIHQVIKEIDLENKKMVILPIEGMLELNAV